MSVDILKREEGIYTELDDSLLKEAEKLLGYKSDKISELILAGFVPFTKKSVEEYKKKAIKTYRRPFYKNSCYFLLASCAFGFLAASFSVFFAIGAAVCFIVAILSALIGSSYEWRSVRIKEYNKQIPEFVLQTAVDVQKAFPSMVLLVEEIQATTDPFLVVTNGAHDYYLEVWNEPSYKQERVV